MGSHTALITGASAGIGASFARQLASQGYNLVLVARDEDRLSAMADSLSSQYGVDASVISADLSTEDGIGAVAERIYDAANPVHMLVNNAGHGIGESFLESESQAERDLMTVHMVATMELCHAAGRMMRKRRAGRIINVASVAGFMATGTYSAAKSWVINFSQALHGELKPHNVSVTALCPGLVHTEFHERAGISPKGASKWMWLEPDDVVRQALTANAQGTAVNVPSRTYQALTTSLKLVPTSVVQWVAGRTALTSGDQSGSPQPRTEADIANHPDVTAERTSSSGRKSSTGKGAKDAPSSKRPKT